MAYGSPLRIDSKLVTGLQRDKFNGKYRSISAVIQTHRRKSFKLDKLQDVLTDWLKDNPNRSIGDFYAYLNKVGIIHI